MNPGPSSQAVLLALTRLLAWPELARSPQLANFLEYIVHRKLEGQEQSIKAYSIAVDVFGRPPNFDPQSDPIVRVQARRLRALLNAYYSQEGQAERIQIRLPTGRYIPDFVQTLAETERGSPVEPSPEPGSAPKPIPVRLVLSTLLLLGFVLGAIVANRLFNNSAPRPGTIHLPVVSVVQFTNLTENTGDVAMVSGLAIELVTDLDQFEFIDARYAGSALQAAPVVGIDYVITGVARGDGDAVQYSAQLTDTRSKAVVWEKAISVSREAAHQPSILDELSRSFSLVLGSPRGPLHVRARTWAISAENQGHSANLYLCRTLFDLYRETRDRRHAESANSCIQGLPQNLREDPAGIAMRASLVSELSPLNAEGRPSGASAALQDLERAIAASPLNSFIWEQQARLHQAMDQTDLAFAGYLTALQLNPANSDALAAAGLLLATTGQIKEARPLVRDAIDGAPEPPAWYFGGAAMLALVDKNFPLAVQFSERLVQVDPELGAVLALAAGQGATDQRVVERYRPQVMATTSFRELGILPRLRQTITDPTLIDMISSGLVAAGVPAEALEKPF